MSTSSTFFVVARYRDPLVMLSTAAGAVEWSTDVTKIERFDTELSAMAARDALPSGCSVHQVTTVKFWALAEASGMLAMPGGAAWTPRPEEAARFATLAEAETFRSERSLAGGEAVEIEFIQ